MHSVYTFLVYKECIKSSAQSALRLLIAPTPNMKYQTRPPWESATFMRHDVEAPQQLQNRVEGCMQPKNKIEYAYETLLSDSNIKSTWTDLCRFIQNRLCNGWCLALLFVHDPVELRTRKRLNKSILVPLNPG